MVCSFVQKWGVYISIFASTLTIVYTSIGKWNAQIEREYLSGNLTATKEAMEQRMKLFEANLQQNIQQILQYSDEITDLQANSAQINAQIDKVKHNMFTPEQLAIFGDMTDLYELQSSENWIAGITAHPPLQPFGNAHPIVCDDYHRDLSDFGVETLTNGLRRIKRGYDSWREQQLKNPKHFEFQDTANLNIAHPDTPSTLRPHDCLQFAADDGNRWIEIKLSQSIIPAEFLYIHIDKASISEEDLLMAPSGFRLFGKDGSNDWSTMDVVGSTSMDDHRSVLKMEFVSNERAIDSMRIEWDTRELASSTRLYRMVVRGHPAHQK